MNSHGWCPNGNGDRFRNLPLLRELDLPPLGGDGHGGPVLTKTLLISALTAGGADGGPRLVARDKTTGGEVASVDLPSGAIGTPMTYMHDGKQYIALTIGGDIPELIALALPLRSHRRQIEQLAAVPGPPAGCLDIMNPTRWCQFVCGAAENRHGCSARVLR